ncbi:flagellar biosynthesis anti-sigma factor FlgM [Alphaproteobacteria bacterium]|nr:flagellar biosynthesis anti-sigma factor FlgM [Alphaproteobacteria bacterium]
MVGIVKNTVSRMEPPKAAVPDRVSQEATKVSSAAAANASDSVELKSADVPSSVKQMASSAPIDEVNVNRIKEAIKRGDYPIDIDRVSDALMEAYRELKT